MLRRPLCTVLLFSSCAFAGGVSIPDWVRQAAQEKIDVPATAQAVVLLDDESISVHDSGETFTKYRRVVKILRPQGRDHAIVGAGFDREKKLLSLHAWSISPKGEEYEVKDKEFVEHGDFGEELYSDIKVKMARPPAADPGAVIAFEVEQRDRPYMLEDDWTFQEDIPVKHAVYSLTLPASWEYKATWVRHPEVKPAISGGTSTWELRDIPAIEDEPAMPARSSLAGLMVVAYFTSGGAAAFDSWSNIGKWYSGLTADRRVATPEIIAAAKELTGGKSSFTEKVKQIAAFMQTKVRYVSIQIGIGGFQPHLAGEIIQKHYGDCKDKATLMSALLQQSGIESHYLLVHTSRGVVSKDAPSTHFDHVILAIDLPDGTLPESFQSIVKESSGKQYLLFDPTDEFTPVGMLHSGLQQSHGLLVLDKTGELISIPLFAPETNRLARKAQLKLTDDGAISGEVTEMLTGHLAWHRRALAIHSTDEERRKSLENFLSSFVGGFKLTDVKFENLQDFDRDLVVKYSFTAQAYAKKAGPLVLLRPRVLGSKIPEFGIPPRKNPFAFDSASRQVDDFYIELPAGYVVDELPDPAKIGVGFAAYSSKVESSGKNIHYSREYLVREVRVDKEKQKDFERLAGTISADERGSAVLKKAQ